MLRLDRRAAVLGLGAAAFGIVSLAGAVASPSYDDPDEMYDALRRQPGEILDVGAGTIKLVFADGAPGLDRRRVASWVRTAAAAVTAYFGHYPVKDYGLLVIADPGDRVGHATTFGYAGTATRIHVGVAADATAFHRDWVLVHEMVHTALPDLPRRALWLQEGNATYVEPIARALIGELPVEEVWRESMLGMPKGIPKTDDPGMDGTHAWGRLYWGGATFWLLAEIAIYQDSRGRYSLRDALRRINRESEGNTVDWSPEQLMTVGDAAAGTRSLRDLYSRFARQPVATDLGDLFRQLGIGLDTDGRTRTDNGAPLADLRRRITTK
ncbi:MAG: hypothetical protein BVN33_07565 [Proteobacteria bacterium ST_bin13]|nr:MAG: hypothetical protein BVN33_07565 [Proteobacteria bacterium ST_bin13]